MHYDRVLESTTSTGTGNLNLAGAENTYRTLAATLGDGNTGRACIMHTSANEWEICDVTLTAGSPDVIARGTPVAGSNGTSAVDFSAGTKYVFLVADAAFLNAITMNADTDVSGNSWVVDEDDMASDSDEKVPTQQSVKAYVDNHLLTRGTYLGNWNAADNTPTLADGTGTTLDLYRVSVAGSQNLGSGSISFAVGDYVIYNGSTWEKDAVEWGYNPGDSVDGDNRRLIYHGGDRLPPDWTMASSTTDNAQIAGWSAVQAYLETNIARNRREPAADTLSTPTGTYPGSTAFQSGVLLPDGRVFCVPRNSTTARIYDPDADTLSTPTGTYPGSDAFFGGVLLPDGRVFCVPLNSTSARIYRARRTTHPPAWAILTSPFFNKF